MSWSQLRNAHDSNILYVIVSVFFQSYWKQQFAGIRTSCRLRAAGLRFPKNKGFRLREIKVIDINIRINLTN